MEQTIIKRARRANDIVSPRFLTQVLQRDYILEGISELVRITTETGYEAAFDVYKRARTEKLYISKYITIGDEDSVSQISGLNRLAWEYLDKTGKDPRNKSNQDDFERFVRNHEIGFQSPMPKQGEIPYGEGDRRTDYALITFHSHPDGIALASRKDLLHLNNMRRRDFKRTLRSNPISIVIGVYQDSTKTRDGDELVRTIFGTEQSGEIMLFQEKSEWPHSIKTIKRAAKSYLSETAEQSKKSYNIARGQYHADEKRIEVPAGLLEFGFRF
ncbi:MAG: hypothetical protein ABII01_05150 [Candidatus Woesearchaeota archaeon]